MSDLTKYQEKYGKPTVEQAIEAYYTLCMLKEKASKIEYMHNFQRERTDIVDYVYGTHEIMKVLKGYYERSNR